MSIAREWRRLEWTVSESGTKRRNASKKSSEECRLPHLPNSLWILCNYPVLQT